MSRNTNRQWWKHAANASPHYSKVWTYRAMLDDQEYRDPLRPEERKNKIARGILYHVKASLPQGYMGDVGWRVREWTLVVTHPYRSAVVVGTVGVKSIDFRVSSLWTPEKEHETSVLLSDVDFDLKSMAAIMKLVNAVEVAKARYDEFRRTRASKS